MQNEGSKEQTPRRLRKNLLAEGVKIVRESDTCIGHHVVVGYREGDKRGEARHMSVRGLWKDILADESFPDLFDRMYVGDKTISADQIDYVRPLDPFAETFSGKIRSKSEAVGIHAINESGAELGDRIRVKVVALKTKQGNKPSALSPSAREGVIEGVFEESNADSITVGGRIVYFHCIEDGGVRVLKNHNPKSTE